MSGAEAGDEPGTAPHAPIDPTPWRQLLQEVLADEGVTGELDLTFVDETDMAELNGQHMGQPGPTDVLAFPLDADLETPGAGSGPDIPVLLGDVVICPTVARRNAPDHEGGGHDGTIDDELALLVVHGVLHVLGWDHATDEERAAMQARERHHLERRRVAR